MTTVGVLGAGSWGTALALHLSHSGTATRLWCRRPELASEMISERVNTSYLPGAALPEQLGITASLEEMSECDPIRPCANAGRGANARPTIRPSTMRKDLCRIAKFTLL